MSKHPKSRSQISHANGWMQPMFMGSVSFLGKCTSGSRISASRSDLLKVPSEHEEEATSYNLVFVKHYGICDAALQWIESFFSYRYQFVQFNQTCSPMQTITCGVARFHSWSITFHTLRTCKRSPKCLTIGRASALC